MINIAKSPIAGYGSLDLFMVMQCKLFADVGGAGMLLIGGVALAKLDRSAGAVMTQVELAKCEYSLQWLQENYFKA